MTHNPYHVTPRNKLTPKQKLKMFVEHDGKCCICGHKINAVREAWDEHVDPLWRNGTNDMGNRAPAHEKCARQKTSEEADERAKGQRVAEKHFGAKETKGPPIPGSKRSGWKRKMNGELVRR